jgi:cyclohexadienyl dehydratase
VMTQTLRQAELLVVAPPMVRETELEAGRADIFMADFPYTRRMLYQFDWAEVIEPTEPLAVTRYAYAIRQGDPAWLDRINQFVSRIKADGRLRQAAARYDLTRIVIAD